MVGKGLTILGEPGVGVVATPFVVSVLRVANTTSTQALMTGPIGQLGALFLGELGNVHGLPALAGEIWLASGAPSFGTFGVFGPALQLSLLVPNVPGLLGIGLVWQGATFSLTSAFLLSNPAVFTP